MIKGGVKAEIQEGKFMWSSVSTGNSSLVFIYFLKSRAILNFLIYRGVSLPRDTDRDFLSDGATQNFENLYSGFFFFF